MDRGLLPYLVRRWSQHMLLPFIYYTLFLFFFFLNFFLIFRETGKERETEGEKHQCVVASHSPLTGVLACNPGMCPDWELKPQPLWFAGPR